MCWSIYILVFPKYLTWTELTTLDVEAFHMTGDFQLTNIHKLLSFLHVQTCWLHVQFKCRAGSLTHKTPECKDMPKFYNGAKDLNRIRPVLAIWEKPNVNEQVHPSIYFVVWILYNGNTKILVKKGNKSWRPFSHNSYLCYVKKFPKTQVRAFCMNDAQKGDKFC